MANLLERVEVVGDVPGDDVHRELVHEVIEALAGLHLEISDHDGRQSHCIGVGVLVVPLSVLDYR